MWAVSPIPPKLFFTNPTRPFFRRFEVTLPRSAPHQNDDDDYGKGIGGLGHSLLTAATKSDVNFNTGPNPKRQKEKQIEEEEKELSGSDVLLALQRVASKKKKKNKKRRELSSAGSDKEDDVDYSNVKPLCIKSKWADKLNELEKHLQELSEIDSYL